MKTKLLIFLNLIALNCYGIELPVQESLEKSIIEDNAKAVEKLLNEFSLSADSRLDKLDGSHPLLISAAKNNAIKVAKLLIERGANVDLMDANEYAPLDRAVENRNAGMASLLLNNFANPHTTRNALYNAIYNDDYRMVCLLFNRRARVLQNDIFGKTIFDPFNFAKIRSSKMENLLFIKLEEEQQESKEEHERKKKEQRVVQAALSGKPLAA